MLVPFSWTPPPADYEPGEEDEDLVAELCEIESGLSDWEVEFVDSIARHLENFGTLTTRQRTKAEQIARKMRNR